PSVTVLAAYADVIGRWSRRQKFTLDLTLLNRMPLHPDVDRIVGDFTGVSLLEVDGASGQTFAVRASNIQAQLWDDLDHRLYGGIELVRELARHKGKDAALMPIVYTSAIGLGPKKQSRTGVARLVHGISQTPQ